MRSFWSEAIGSGKRRTQISHPVFWRKTERRWLYRTMFEEIPLPLDWPVYVSHAEASAYARWAGKSLPTEEQWHRAAYGTRDGNSSAIIRGATKRQTRLSAILISTHWDPTPVNAFPRAKARSACRNGGQWLGVDFHRLRAVSWLRAFSVLPWILG